MFFSAATSGSPSVYPPDPIPFGLTLADMSSGAWDGEYFTCPRDGFYMFWVSINNYGGHSGNCYIRLHRSAIGEASTIVSIDNDNNSSGTVYYTSAMHAIIECLEWERVWLGVQPQQGAYCRMRGEGYAQFSGMLVKEGLL